MYANQVQNSLVDCAIRIRNSVQNFRSAQSAMRFVYYMDYIVSLCSLYLARMMFTRLTVIINNVWSNPSGNARAAAKSRERAKWKTIIVFTNELMASYRVRMDR